MSTPPPSVGTTRVSYQHRRQRYETVTCSFFAVFGLIALALIAWGAIQLISLPASPSPTFPAAAETPASGLLPAGDTAIPVTASLASPTHLVTPTDLPTATAVPTATPLLPILTQLPPTDTPTLAPSPTQEWGFVRFAVIGDYGTGDKNEADVASLVKSWDPDFVITVGDNNYPHGMADTIDQKIGQFYHEYIFPYTGSFGEGAAENRFFPAIGNHDWGPGDYQPYLDYFELPGNERYYDFTWGPVHLYSINSDSREPDKVGRSSTQAAWLRERLAASDRPWNIVYTHYPPFTSGHYFDTDWIQWPFTEWGATAVLSGHEHNYERLIIDSIPYFVNGLGGGELYPLASVHPGSAVQFDTNHGAMLVEATASKITFQLITIDGKVQDVYIQALP